MALSTYFNCYPLQTPISEICSTNFHEVTPELAQDRYHHLLNLPYSDESFFLPNNFLDPYFDQTEFLCPDEIYPSCTSSYDPFISLNDIFQTDEGFSNSLLPCPKRQKCYERPNFFDGFVPNPCSSFSQEELFPAVPEFKVPQFTQGASSDIQGCEKKGGERTISAQSIAARGRRRKITEKTQELGKLVPGGPKMNTAEMLHAASKYVKYLQAQVGMLQLMNTLKEEDKAVIPTEGDLHALVASPFVQEKLYSEEMCFVPKEFVTTLANHGNVQSMPTILKDLKQLIGIDIEEKTKQE